MGKLPDPLTKKVVLRIQHFLPNNIDMTLMRTALVTGAAQGLGKAIAWRLASDGFSIGLNDINLEALKETQARFEERSYRTICVAGDVTKAKDVERMIAETVEKLGPLHVFVANAGSCVFKAFLETTEEDLERVHSTNIRGTFLCYKYAAKQMIAQGKGGKIIGACSIAGQRGEPMMSAYSSSKFAVHGLTQVAAAEFGKFGINVNCYAPGGMETPMWEKLGEQAGPGAELVTQAEIGVTPLGRFGRPEDVAGVVSFLASDAANWVTGQAISIDGGRRLIGSPYHGRN